VGVSGDRDELITVNVHRELWVDFASFYNPDRRCCIAEKLQKRQ